MKKNITSRNFIFCFVLTVIFPCSINTLFAGQYSYNVNNQNIALHGYDPVSYFQSKPTKGLNSLSYEYNKVNYIFSNKKNKTIFMDNPDKHIPVFGGYCAYGVRVGKKLDIDPNAYAIEAGRLYMLLNRSTKNLWDKDRERNIAIAKRLWPTIKSVTPESLNN